MLTYVNNSQLLQIVLLLCSLTHVHCVYFVCGDDFCVSLSVCVCRCVWERETEHQKCFRRWDSRHGRSFSHCPGLQSWLLLSGSFSSFWSRYRQVLRPTAVWPRTTTTLIQYLLLLLTPSGVEAARWNALLRRVSEALRNMFHANDFTWEKKPRSELLC